MNDVSFDSPSLLAYISPSHLEVQCRHSMQPFITVYIRASLRGPEQQRIQSIAAANGIVLEPRYVGDFSDFGVPASSIFIRDVSHFEPFMQSLYNEGLITPEQRQSVAHLIKKIDQIVQYKSKISSDPATSIRDCILSLIEPYIDSVLESSHSYRDIIPLLQLLCSGHISEVRGGYTLEQSYLIWLKKRGLYEEKAFTMQVECMTALHKIANPSGDSDLSSTYMRFSGTIPSLTSIYQVIIEVIKERFEEKHAQSRTEFDSIYVDLSLKNLVNAHCPGGKYISYAYKIDDDSGFPRRVEEKDIDGNFLCYKKDFSPTPEESELLQKYHLRRFPVSEEDLAAARMEGSSSTITIQDPDLLVHEFDDSIYQELSIEQRLVIAMSNKDVVEIRRLLEEYPADTKKIIDKKFDYSVELFALGLSI